MRDCTTGVHNGILAISRTYDSVEVRVPTSLHALAPARLASRATDIEDAPHSSPGASIAIWSVSCRQV